MTLISKATRASYIGSHNHKSLGKIIPRVDLSVSFSRTGATSKMKGPLVFATVFVLLSPTFCFNVPLSISSGRKGSKLIKTGSIRPSLLATKIGVDAAGCSFCVDFMEQAIDQLLNIIANVGIVGTCGDLCQLLAQKTGSQALGVACDLLCDIEGIQEFVKIIQSVDPDPIYICELLKTCPINDNGDCKITKLGVTPQSGPQGEFVISFTYVSQNGTGTGQMVVEVQTVDGVREGSGFLLEAQAAGSYPAAIKLNAQPDPDCDPTQQPCERWLPGNYSVKIAICNGECGSKHPHSQIYDEAETTFTITG